MKNIFRIIKDFIDGFVVGMRLAFYSWSLGIVYLIGGVKK